MAWVTCVSSCSSDPLGDKDVVVKYYQKQYSVLKQLHLQFTQVKISKMGASPSSFRVEQTSLQQYSYSTLLEKDESKTESFRLFRVTSLRYEAVLNRTDQHPKCLSVFRMDDEKAAREKFRYKW